MNYVRNKTDLCSSLIFPPNSVYFPFAVFHLYSDYELFYSVNNYDVLLSEVDVTFLRAKKISWFFSR